MQKNILNIFRGVFFQIFFIFIIILLINSCKIEDKTIQGKIIVVGNEPFTRFAITNNKQDVYLLNYNKNIEKILLENQGNFAIISYDKKEIISSDTLLTITKIEIMKQKNNGDIYE